MLTFTRVLSQENVPPFDTVTWTKHNIVISDSQGKAIYSCPEAEFPTSWSLDACKIVASKYFNSTRKEAQTETSLKQLLTRVVDYIVNEGLKQSYFDKENSKIFGEELTLLLLQQHGSFNSPVWFNCGLTGKTKPQCSACFINAVDDDIQSILDLVKIEGQIFKKGSGSGVNLSSLRGEKEPLKGGGNASGPVSFMEIYDTCANVILSGGKTRRAARMAILNIDHPDISHFIRCKADQEKIVRMLAEAGMSVNFSEDNNAYSVVKHQSGNHSIHVTNDFMEKARQCLLGYKKDEPWNLVNRLDGKVSETVSAKSLFKQIAESAHFCGDPGIQFHDTINKYNTCIGDGEISASNPCLSGNMKLACWTFKTCLDPREKKVEIPLKELAEYSGRMQVLNRKGRYTNGGAFCTGRKELFAIKFGDETLPTLEATADHRWLLIDNHECTTRDLVGKKIQRFDKTDTRDTTVLSVESIGVQDVYDFFEPETHWGVVEGFVSHNCGEFVWLPNSACNLASLNLLKFSKGANEFDIKLFKHAVRTFTTAQDILIDAAGYPTEKIKENSHKYRPIGLGYSNLGGFLMSWGLPYDSDNGRGLAAAITSLLTATSYRVSAEIAETLGSFERFEDNKLNMEDVLQRQYNKTKNISKDVTGIQKAAQDTWKDALGAGFGARRGGDAGKGFRNAQATLLAPCGTISFMMDCATTGIEPDTGLRKVKTMVGNSTMSYVNSTIKDALKSLGYAENDQEDLVQYVNLNGHMEGSKLKPEHLPVFDCAIPCATRYLSVDAHIEMVAAVQPFLSGAISKTFNMPNDSSVRDVEMAFLKAWERGLKGIAIYRTGSKMSEPLQIKKLKEKDKKKILKKEDLPNERDAKTHKFTVGGHTGYLTVGNYKDGRPGEVFIRMAKHGSIVSGLLDSFAILFSLALQYGIPLETLIRKFKGMKFTPAGFTDNPDIRSAQSILDYLAQWMEKKYFTKEIKANGHSPEEEIEDINVDPCPVCGGTMVQTGSCHHCRNCGQTSGVCS